jgi:hypothetical protein
MLNGRNRIIRRVSLVAVSASGLVFQGSCSLGIEALAAGLQAAAASIAANQPEDNDINFGDWLAGELRD